MTQRGKLMQRFYNEPTSLKYIKIESILIKSGFIKIPTKGSHMKFKHETLEYDLVIPVHNNDCKDFYKKLALKYLKLIT